MQKQNILALLKLIEQNSRLTDEELGILLGTPEEEIHDAIAQLEKDGIVCGYQTLINWDKVTDDAVTALVELRVTPQGGDGYDKLAEKIRSYPQVKTLYLMSGAYDFLVIVTGQNLKEISIFVNSKLANIHEVQNTTTHFILTKYKELGVSFAEKKPDPRMVVTP
ncbi:MAG: Lrp/AsnC family transcriptional regulator [Clostridiales bacterium]|nr:Lrp/AsnC family transcriptional regulator [Clostridiales bacterium]MCD8155245.1 Lrp/AsnC family transcriptional regulator [Clostridiales bacterium]